MDTKRGFTLFVVNPAAANGELAEKLPDLEAEIKTHFADAEIVKTEGTGHARDLVRDGLGRGASLVVSVGGDGTFNEVVNGFLTTQGHLVSQKSQLGALIMGTGGDIRRSFGWADDLKSGLQRLKNGQVKRLDVGRLTSTDMNGVSQSRYYMNEATLGVAAEIARSMNHSGKLLGGKVGYYLATAQAIFSYETQPLDLDLDGRKVHYDKCLFATFANGQYFGGGMKVAPNAKNDDGFLEEVAVTDIGFSFFIRHGLSIYSGKHIQLPQVKTGRVKKAIASTSSSIEVPVECDGEPFGKLPATFEILPQALPVLF